MKQLLKIVLILFDSPSPQHTNKTCFHILWFNYELEIETGNENTKCPTNSQLWLNISKQNTVFFFFSKEGKDLCHYSRGVQCKSTRGVQCKSTIEV